MNILITGGAGFIGTHLTKMFLSKGYTVVAVDDLSTGDEKNISEFLTNKKYSFHQSNLAAPLLDFDLDTAVKECDVIYHLASIVGVALVDREPHKTLFANMEMALKLFPIIEKYNKKLVFTSTSEVYGEAMTEAGFDENMTLQIKPPTKLRWGYASTKLTQEFLVHSYNFPFVIARLFNIVGPKQKGDFGMVLPRFINWAKNNQDIVLYGTGLQTRCFCHIDFCTRALFEMGVFKECVGEIINIGSNEETSMESLAQEVIRITGSSSRIVRVPYDQDFSDQHEDIMRRVPNTTKLHKLLGIENPNTLKNIIEDML